MSDIALVYKTRAIIQIHKTDSTNFSNVCNTKTIFVFNVF